MEEKKTLRATEQERPDVAAARERFRATAAAIRPEDFVFLDESGATTALVRRYARVEGGRRALGRVPAGHWTQLTILSALSLAGLGATMTVDAPTDTAVFTAYVRHLLVPTLRPGRVVVLDNLSAHRTTVARGLIEGAGCRLLFLPPYSPEFNPIEQTWSKLKTLLRGAARRGRPHARRAGDRAASVPRPDHRCRCPRVVRPLRLHGGSQLTRQPLERAGVGAPAAARRPPAGRPTHAARAPATPALRR